MILDNIQIIFVIATITILGGIAVFIYSILKKEHEFQEKEKETFQQYKRILKKAHTQARSLLETTSAASQELWTETKATNEDLTENLDKVLQTMAQKHIETMSKQAQLLQNDYKNKVTQMQNQIDQNTEQMIQNAQKDITGQVAQFSQVLIKNATSSEETINKKTQELLLAVENEITEYKKQRLAKIEADVSQIVQKTYQEVLHTSIPEDIQQQLILEALEKAKQEGILTL